MKAIGEFKYMDFEDANLAIENFVSAMPSLFEGVRVDFAFGSGCPQIGDWSNPDNPGMLLSGDGIGNQSGVYFIASPNGEIIYIGKATKKNLHHRVWDHMKTPQVTEDGRRIFPNHGFAGITNAAEQAAFVREGGARLGVVTVSDSDLVSLIEVFLHTVYMKKHGKLPALNKQIG